MAKVMYMPAKEKEVKIPFRNIPELFRWRAEETPSKPAYSYKSNNTWIDVTWSEFFVKAKCVASALVELGVKRQDRVVIYSYNRLEWILADVGAMLAGGISVPIYHSLPWNQGSYIVNDSDTVVAFVENPVIIEEIKKSRNQVPLLAKVISLSDEVKEDDFVIKFSTLEKIGKENLSKNESKIAENIEATKLDDLATFVYTSGTTGVPKGVMQTHLNHLSTVEMLYSFRDFVFEDDVVLLFLPLAHSFARAIEYLHPRAGVKIAIAESIEKVVDNLSEVRPTIFPSVPRVFEKVYAKVKSDVEVSPVKKKIFDWALRVGSEVGKLKIRKEKIPWSLSVQYALAHKLVFSKLHKRLGGRIRYFVSGGAPLPKDIAEFFWSAGLLILEGYGLTETTPAISINALDDFKFGTVGKPLKWVEVKIAQDGEILARGPNIAKGYWKKPKETEEVFKPDGWFHTGDIGEFDEDGFLRITDRKKDLIKTAGGKYVAPQPIENSIKTKSPLISQVVVIGDMKPYCVALITLNKDEVLKWAETRHLPSDYSKIIESDELKAEIQKAIDEVNATLAPFETVKKFRIVPDDFSIEDGLLTPTLKVRRRQIMQKYESIINSMYNM